ncbi:hypothetical protein HG531_005548 [Fusarium graminearum]|nr:hypothetical protein HG531_005548 [Fusarium graminearum]
MKRRSIIPDGAVILAPSVSDLGIMILCDQVEEIGEESIALILGKSVDALGKTLVDKHRLPACYWVCSDQRMNGCELLALVQRRATDALADRVAEAACFIVEECRVVCESQHKVLHLMRSDILVFEKDDSALGNCDSKVSNVYIIPFQQVSDLKTVEFTTDDWGNVKLGVVVKTARVSQGLVQAWSALGISAENMTREGLDCG